MNPTQSTQRYYHPDGKTCRFCNQIHRDPKCPNIRLNKITYSMCKAETYSDGTVVVSPIDEVYVDVFDGKIYHEGPDDIIAKIVDTQRYGFHINSANTRGKKR